MSVFTTDDVSDLYSEILNTDFIVIYRACVEVEYNRGLFKLEICYQSCINLYLSFLAAHVILIALGKHNPEKNTQCEVHKAP